jgi:hypothetical protein
LNAAPDYFMSQVEANRNYFGRFGSFAANGSMDGAITVQHVFELSQEAVQFAELRALVESSNIRLNAEILHRAQDNAAAQEEYERLKDELRRVQASIAAEKQKCTHALQKKDEEVTALRCDFQAKEAKQNTEVARMTEEMGRLRKETEDHKAIMDQDLFEEMARVQLEKDKYKYELHLELANVVAERDSLEEKLGILSRCFGMSPTDKDPSLTEQQQRHLLLGGSVHGGGDARLKAH